MMHANEVPTATYIMFSDAFPVSEKRITRVGTIIKPPPFPKSPAVIPAKQPAASKAKSKRKISKVHFL